MACTGQYVGLRNIYLSSYVELPTSKLLGIQAVSHNSRSRRAFMKSPKDSRRFLVIFRRSSRQTTCAAGQESTTSTYSKKENQVDSTTVESGSAKSADASGLDKASTSTTKGASSAKTSPPKPKVAAAKKAPSKPLPELMSEEIIPSLQAMLENQKDVSDIALSYQDNQLDGSFVKNGIPYCFWVFFPDGTLEGTKAFSLSSHGSPPSTVEPFLTIERKVNPKLLVFWIQKRLSAQKILSPVKLD
eukprot:Gb_40330 [translate_table: standard]